MPEIKLSKKAKQVVEGSRDQKADKFDFNISHPAGRPKNQDPAQNKGGTFIVADNLDPHAVTGIVPEMDAETFEGFKADIQAKGLLVPIVLFQGQILDGRARYRACKELGRPVVARKWEGGMDPVDYIRAANLLRSHNTQGQGTGLKIEPLTICLHGKPCPHLQAPGEQRPVCRVNGGPIFDFERCPKGLWFEERKGNGYPNTRKRSGTTH